MINFIVCDDNDQIRHNIETLIDTLMMNNNDSYHIHSYDDYNNEFLAIIDNKMSCKIYILDIETPSRSGIDIARKIRDQDCDSIIIFLTGYAKKYQDCILEQEFLFLALIRKYYPKTEEDYTRRLVKSLLKAVQIVRRKRALRFTDQGVIYTIPFHDILYITINTVQRKTIIKTSYTEFSINKTFTWIKDQLEVQFVQSHRSCIVNMDNVVALDCKRKKITFKDGTVIAMISDSYKQQLMDYKTAILCH